MKGSQVPSAIVFPEGFVKGAVRVQVAEIVRDIGPIPGHDVVQILNKHRAVIGRTLQALHGVDLVYIHSWTHPGDSNTLAPVWAWRTSARQRDAKRPPPMTQTEVNIRWNARHAAYRNTIQRAKRGTVASIWAGLL